MSEGQVSVIMPVRNGRKFIVEAIRSALDQGSCVDRVIVIDDGSTDGTGDVVKAIGDPRVHLVVNTGRAGLPGARNFGIARAEGQWLVFLDSDDRFAPGAVSRLLKAATVDAVGIYGEYDRIDASGRRVGRRHLIRHRRKPSGDVLHAIVGANFIVVGCAIFRRDAVNALGGFDEDLRLAEDWHMSCRLATMGPFVYVPGLHVVDYRVHDDSMVHRRALTFEEFSPVIERIFTDDAIRRRLGDRLAERRRQAEGSLRSYTTMEAVRIRSWRVATQEMIAAARRSPGSVPRLTFRLAASMAGF